MKKPAKKAKGRDATRVCYFSRLNVEKPVHGIMFPFKRGCWLFNSGRKWWLAYTGKGMSKTNNTGSFKSKKKAMDWYENGGR